MSIFDRRPALRWLTPLAFLAVVGGTTSIYATATAGSSLKPISPQTLLANVQQAKVAGLSGTIQQTSDLGLPSIPGVGGADDASLTSLVTGTHTLNVWYAGTDKSRLRVNANLNESDLIVNGRNVWNWSYQKHTATHRVLPAQTQHQAATHKLPADMPKTPQAAASQALAQIDSTTKVSVDPSQVVAHRDAYELVLRPKDRGSLIRQVKIAVDGVTFIPLQVEVISTNGASVFKVGYTQVDFNRPNDSEFAFTAPKGTKVTEVKPQAETAAPHAGKSTVKTGKAAAKPTAADQPKVYGHGWSSVVVSKMGSAVAGQATGQLGSVLNKLPLVPDAEQLPGRVFSGNAFSVVMLNDGRVAAGAVAPNLLYQALRK